MTSYLVSFMIEINSSVKLYEFEGKNLFEKYGIPVPQRVLLERADGKIPFLVPYTLKAQTLSGDRKRAGGILFADKAADVRRGLKTLFGKSIRGERVSRVLVEEKIPAKAEYYISLSYDTDARGPVLALSPKGGSGIAKAKTFSIDPLDGTPLFFLRGILKQAGFPSEDLTAVSPIIKNLWRLFEQEYALLAEINPLIKTPEGTFVAADAKIILDDEKLKPGERRFIEMGGDIAILASGGGASLLNIDTLLRAGGKPANYTEYSGNPPAEVVTELTKRVLSKKNLRGCWVVGGTANFTDIYETMRGFVEGLRQVRPKPRYPIVIRRDGPRQKEANEMLRSVAAKEGYDFHMYGSETPMAESAKIIVKMAYKKR